MRPNACRPDNNKTKRARAKGKVSAFLCFFVCFLCNSYSQRWSTLMLFFSLSRRFRLILTVTSSPLSRLPMSCCVWCWVVIPSCYYPLLFFFFPTSHWLPLLEQCPSFLPLATLVLVLVLMPTPNLFSSIRFFFYQTNKHTPSFRPMTRTYIPFCMNIGMRRGQGEDKTRRNYCNCSWSWPCSVRYRTWSTLPHLSLFGPSPSLSLSLQWVRAQGLQGICTICNMDVRLKYTHHTWP